ncbi:MAG: C-GCAxxG-C-C family protein [Bacillota bacterium]
MSNKAEEVLAKHKKGYNCAQAVACVYSDNFDVTEKEAFRAMESFGLGMGTMQTCGAVSALAYLVGLKVSDCELDQPKTKAQCYKVMREMIQAFEEKNESVVCRTIKGVDTGVMLRSCDGCMTDAAELVEQYLLSK